MSDLHAGAIKPENTRMRAWVICLTLAIAVAIPILPLKFLGVPGPDFFHVHQVVEGSRTWLNSIASPRTGAVTSPESPAETGTDSLPERVKLMGQAAQSLSSQLEKTPDDPDLHNQLGLIYFSLDDVDSALCHFQTSVSLCRQKLNNLHHDMSTMSAQGKTTNASQAVLSCSKLGIALSAAHSNLARLYESRGEHDKVLSELDLVNSDGVLFSGNINQEPHALPTQSLPPEAVSALARAEALMQLGQYQQADLEYRKVLAFDPQVALAHHRLGTISAMTNDPTMAVDELAAAAKLDPKNDRIQYELGMACQAARMKDPAVACFQKAIALSPKNIDSALNLSTLYASDGHLDEAASVLKTAVRFDPLSAKAHNNLATILSLGGDYSRSLAEFQHALRLAPDMASAHYGIGVVLLQTKSYTEAITSFKQALALDPHLLDAQSKIEECYHKAGLASTSFRPPN